MLLDFKIFAKKDYSITAKNLRNSLLFAQRFITFYQPKSN